MADVKVDASAFLSSLGKTERNQIPFALAKTLTEAAKHGQRRVRKQTREAFELHTEFIPSQVLVTPAKTADAKMNRAYSAVRGSDKIGFMTIHEEGGVRKPMGRAMAVPTFTAQKQIPNLRTRTGRVNPKFMPKRLLEGWPPGTNRGYTSDEGILFRRLRKKDKEAFPFYTFERDVRLKPAWEFESTIRGGITGPWMKSLFTRNLLAAMASKR